MKRVIRITLITIIMVACIGSSAFAATSFTKLQVYSKLKVSGYDSLTIAWKRVKDAEGYEIYQSDNKSGEYLQVMDTGDLSGTISGLVTGKKYYFKVRARSIDKNGNRVFSKYSKPVCGTPSLSKPALSVKSCDRYEAYIHGTIVDGADSWELYRSLKKNKQFVLIASGTAEDTSVDYHELFSEKKRHFYILKEYRDTGLARQCTTSKTVSILLTTKKGGNDAKYDVKKVKFRGESILTGKTIAFVGSSITLGKKSKKQSFADYMVKRDRITAVKSAVSGMPMARTPLTSNSLVNLIAEIKNTKVDMVVIQLSTNDVRLGIPLGEISDSSDIKDFDCTTVAGAIEYMAAYSKTRWNCPVVFFTVPPYGNNEYENMVKILHSAGEKWGFDIMDMYNNPQELFGTEDMKKFRFYMADNIHPVKAGYLKLWTPVMERYLSEIMAGKDVSEETVTENAGENTEETVFEESSGGSDITLEE